MTKFKYRVEILALKEVHEIPGAWDDKQFRGLLTHLEYEGAEDIPEAELKEMASLALSDFEKEEAVEKVLEFRMGEKLNKGQRKNLGNEMQEDPLWIEYSDLSLHEELFHVGCMLYWTFPRNFPSPDIARLTIRLTAMSPEAMGNLKKLTASFLCRVLNSGMDESNIMNRLFDENLEANRFPEADHILWQFGTDDFDEKSRSVTVTVYTSWNWVEDLKGVNEFDATAWADGQLE
ncbi:hypothetical protein SAMN06265375_103337 [Muriicola jejuensis]|uniref:Uncharacterized protein n=1 Tax=Muriicola jejuensis TaxID=504488 RepID=A0A6P0UHL1_9FLAO|nr:hypothetical protein [Muriicola jejuensis]NER11308.1 hypothetical protein [Muriicola jejuensis]SMP21538.1 hypothetical protein SAMN06265375_103337 [Muriicola jejuensis]